VLTAVTTVPSFPSLRCANYAIIQTRISGTHLALPVRVHLKTAKRIAQLKAQVAGIKTGSELVQRAEHQAATGSTKREGKRQSDASPNLRVVTKRKHKTSARENTRVAGFEYKQRKPEDSLLRKVIKENRASFLQYIRSNRDGNSLPPFVIKELEKYIECGVIRKGLALFKCYKCGRPKVVAFSCKGRGFCPSCGGKRMTMQAAHLVDNVIGLIPTRQWVISVSFGDG
jgi:hypothetical protein